MADRRLIVNADDFGQDAAFNRGTARAYDEGIVTSASLMVRWPASAEAVRLAAQRPGLSLGLHLDLGEWSCSAGEWYSLYSVVDTDDGDAVAAEVEAQLRTFSAMVGRGPTHLDSHQHTHRDDPVAGPVRAAADRLGVPLRGHSATTYRGDFYGQSGKGDPYPQGISVEHLLSFLEQLPVGTTELGCHPGLGRPELDTMYAVEREQETAVLCDPRVRAALAQHGIALCSYLDPEQP